MSVRHRSGGKIYGLESIVNNMSAIALRSLRTKRLQTKYDNFKNKRKIEENLLCPFCNERPVKTFKNWYILPNAFPYDRIASRHDLLLAKDHCTEDSITQEAWDELKTLKKGSINENYDLIIEPLQKNKSQPNHFHLHLIVQK